MVRNERMRKSSESATFQKATGRLTTQKCFCVRQHGTVIFFFPWRWRTSLCRRAVEFFHQVQQFFRILFSTCGSCELFPTSIRLFGHTEPPDGIEWSCWIVCVHTGCQNRFFNHCNDFVSCC